MIQIEHLLTVTQVITDQVRVEAAAPPKREDNLPPEELAASHAERTKVMMLLDSAIAKTESIKTQFGNSQDAHTEPTPDGGISWLDKQGMASEVAAVAASGSPVPTDSTKVASDITDGLTAKDPQGLNNQTMSLKQMTEAAKPILQTFDSILIKKDLENYNASLNTAPVVGFKDNHVMYVKTKSNRSPVGNVTDETWAVFDTVPKGFDASNGATHFFPYEGNLYVANGTKLWVRKCRPQSDTTFKKEAINNWPKMYYDTWEHLGDQALPASDLSDIVPWATLTADNSVVKFKLVALTSGGELQVLQQESLSSSNKFLPIPYAAKSKSPANPPFWARIAYNNGKFVGYDRDYNLWDIVPDFTNNSYTIENKYAVGQQDTFSEYTANDLGLVVAKKDGFLYKRIATTVDTSDAPKDGTNAPVDKTKWIKWIALDGVKNIGVASPGVVLDLLTLTTSLRTRYLETQATLWPVVNTIKTFAGTHKVFLNQVNQAAKAYAQADDIGKQDAELKVGKKAIGHAKAWGGILQKTVKNAQEPVAAMANQLKDVYKDLLQQIGLLNVKLVELKSILKEQEKALSAARVGFWAGIGTLLLGVVGVIAGLATGNIYLVVGGGLLFVGGLIAASVSASKADKAAAAVSRTKQDINLVETAIKELTDVTEQFAKIDKMYSILDMFWGRMLSHAMSINTNDQVLFKIIGKGLLTEDDASYVYAMQMTGELEGGAQAYQDLISAQGIRIPTEDDDDDDDSDDDNKAAVASLGGSGPGSSGFQYVQPLTVEKFSMQVAHAQFALEQGNDDDYEVIINQALATQEASIASISQAPVASGKWFDVETLKGAAGIFLTSSLQANLNALRLSAPEVVADGIRAIGDLLQSRKNLQESLQATLELAKLMSSWSNDPFGKDSEEHERQIKKYKKPALEFCRLARDGATIANNSFAEVNHLAYNHSIEVMRRIDGFKSEQGAIYEAMDRELRSIDVPFPLQLFGSRGQIMGYVEARAKEISAKYEKKVDDVQDRIKQQEASLVSWATFQGQTISWVDMCKTISRNLASVQSLLESLRMELKIDALLYRELMMTQWHQLVGNAQEISSLIGLSGDKGQISLETVIGFGAGLISNGNIPALMSIETDTSPKELLKMAVSPDKHLSKYLEACTSTTAAFYTNMSDLSILPLAADINSGISSKAPKSLLEVVMDLRSQYSNLAAENFTTVSQLMTAAEVQQTVHKQRPTGKRRNDILVQRLLILVGFAQKSVLQTSEAWAAASEDFTRTCSTIKDNVAIYKALMKDLDAAASKKQKELDDYIAGIAADAIACCMISIGIGFGVAFGGAAGMTAAAKKAWTVISKIGSVYEHKGLGWKDMFKTWYKELDISEQASVIANLKSLSKNLEDAATKLADASDLFKSAVMAVQDSGLAVSRMHARLVDASEKMEVLRSIQFDKNDDEEIVYRWKEVADASEAWTDEFSRQGISPILRQFDDDIENKE